MKASQVHARAFTIVEMLVVVAIIGLLVGLVMPALSGVRKKSAKNSETNSLRQVGMAWGMYSNSNDDAALPGYLDVAVQAPPVSGVSLGWGVKYEYPIQLPTMTDKAIPPAPTYNASDPNIAGPWTWRLLSYLDYSHEMVHGYAYETDESVFELVSEAEEIATQPAFGYNGYYIGGFWRMHPINGIQSPRVDFYDHCGIPDNLRLSIPTTVPQISRSAEMITFCSAALMNNSQPVYRYHKLHPDVAGTHLVTGPYLGTQPQWKPDPQDQGFSIQILNSSASVPLGRYTGAIAVLWADGHTDSQGLGALNDQRKWINQASKRDYQHAVCP